MNRKLYALICRRCIELGAEAKTNHYEFSKYQNPPLSDMDKTKLSMRLDAALDELRKWLTEMEAEFEKEE